MTITFPTRPRSNTWTVRQNICFARGAWRFAENTQAGLETSAGCTSYRLERKRQLQRQRGPLR